MLKKERNVLFGNRINYYVPSDDIEHNLLFDTCIIDKMAKSEDALNKINKLKLKGYNFYITDAQMRELHGISDRKIANARNYVIATEPNEKALKIVKSINCKRVSCVALLLNNFCILDGSFRNLDEAASTYPMVEEIYNNKNLHHIKDAVIAEAAIYNNCILITNDNRLCKKVNKYFEGRAMKFEKIVSEF